MKEKLLSIVKSADEHTVLICGNELAYYNNGAELFDSSEKWGNYFDEIMSDSRFECDVDNMQLIVKLKI